MSSATVNPKSAQRVTLTPEMTLQEAMAHVASGGVPIEAYMEWDADRIKRIEARAKAQARTGGQFSIKVSDKGGVHIRGIRGINIRFGLVLYAAALEDLFAHKTEIEKFVADNRSKLSQGKAS